ncbi:PAS domain-containing hybrid sensor histidine kinase/response regulator [Szabonella alba]|uniref:histidine kinase n=1 Tax=Szabonella alba TaxID=2804194 RepID=A0A8K0VB24_9RHOB|nr:PAS domain-containing hybrid sensor histidine kinase/response regulator [Szabonella alba]MBL4916933.1 PAS domain-containing protein [Szabonella alba]
MSATPAKHRDRQARYALLLALAISFLGSVFGVAFGIMAGVVAGVEALIVGFCMIVTGGLLVVALLQPKIASGVIAGLLGIFFVFHLNAGSIVAFNQSGSLLRTLPYLPWFFPLVIFHYFTNMGFYKRPIDLLIRLGPLPIVTVVMIHLAGDFDIEEFDAIVTFLASFVAFVLCVGLYARNRDAEIRHMAEVEASLRRADELRVNEERFRLLSRATNDLIWDADLRSGRIWWNDALQDVYGYDPAELSRDLEAWDRWVHPEDRENVLGGLQAVMEGAGSHWGAEYRLICADGRVMEVVDRALLLRDEAGQPIRMVGSTTDVTRLRDLERKLRQSQKMEAIGQLTGGIAHDFNNLLTIILGNAEILSEMTAHDAKMQRLAETTMLAAERGANLTNRLLAFARKQPLAPRQLEPGKLLNSLQGLIQRTINEDIEIEFIADPMAQDIEVDPGQFENAVLNLVINARDAMPAGGKLGIEIRNLVLDDQDEQHLEGKNVGNFVMIEVRDNGHGMPPEVVERAFEPFFTTKAPGKGSGMGLAMVWGFVKQSNGHARIRSIPGQGTKVRLYFPTATDSQVVETLREPVPSQYHNASGRILVVEDDEIVREHVVMQLQSLGYEVEAAPSAIGAIALLDGAGKFDLLFTDIIMPGGMNGRQLADQALLRDPSLRVLFTSGYSEDVIVHQGRLDPDVELLSKPYRRIELAAKVARILSE